MRVVFVNNDSRPHEMTSDPHPSHEDCPELNQVGFLNPGQQRESGNLVFTRTCGFHDHANPGTQSLQGTDHHPLSSAAAPNVSPTGG